MNDEFDFNTAMASLYPDTEYVINKSAYDSGVEGVREEIVRCKDCEYYRESQWVIATDVPDVCTFFSNGVKVRPDGFCKWGKRKKL